MKVTPQERAHAQTQGDQDGVSVWAPSEFESGGATSSMEDAMVRLMDRVAFLEGRLGVDLDLESGVSFGFSFLPCLLAWCSYSFGFCFCCSGNGWYEKETRDTGVDLVCGNLGTEGIHKSFGEGEVEEGGGDGDSVFDLALCDDYLDFG